MNVEQTNNCCSGLKVKKVEKVCTVDIKWCDDYLTLFSFVLCRTALLFRPHKKV